MVWVKSADRVQHVVESFCAANAASEEVFLCYKFERYQDIFPEKPYFLLSHCAHILFCLWRLEEDSKEDPFWADSRPTAFLAGLDFEKLRYTDYKRRMFHEDSLEDHWRNETQWFEFWMRVLESFDGSDTKLYQEFSRPILAHLTNGNVLDDRTIDKNRKAFSEFMRSDAVGQVLLRTRTVLDELMRAIVQGVAQLDAKAHLLEHVALIAGLLKGIRQILVYQTPARGPYALRGARHWKAPWYPARLLWGWTEGTLTVIPRRQGGEILCIYNPTSGSNDRERFWTHPTSSLAGMYEQELFSTWSAKTGEYRDDPGRFPTVKAWWTLQNEEAGRIEAIAQSIDGLLKTLCSHPVCARLIEEVKSLSRRDSSRWRSMDLPWSYVNDLDRLLTRLAFVHRETKAIGVRAAAAEVVARIWPARPAAPQPTDSPQRAERGDGVDSDPSAGADQIEC